MSNVASFKLTLMQRQTSGRGGTVTYDVLFVNGCQVMVWNQAFRHTPGTVRSILNWLGRPEQSAICPSSEAIFKRDLPELWSWWQEYELELCRRAILESGQ
jgi:hypothetical protein